MGGPHIMHEHGGRDARNLLAMPRLVALAVLLSLAVPAHAQDRDLAIGIGTWTALRTSTMVVNLRCFDAGTCREHNPAFAGMTDRPVLLSSVQIASNAIGAYALWSLRKTHPALARWLTWSLVGLSAVVLVHDAQVGRP